MSNFDPYAKGYSSANALWLAKAARLAYQPPEVIAQQVQTWGDFSHFQFFTAGHTQAYLAGHDDLIILAFRGTETRCLPDWMTDAKILLVPSLGGRVHRGFLEAINLVWKDVVTRLAAIRTNNQRLFITGHSLGAALATLAAAKLQELNEPVDGIYTFGSPRVGDKKFADKFDAALGSRNFRIVNNNDVVTRVAPRECGYSHVSRCLYFDAKNKLQDDILFWEKFLETVRGSMNDFLKPGFDTFKDHDMGLYENHVLTNIDFKLTTDKPRWVQKLM
jgi:triacylglycerol lipase